MISNSLELWSRNDPRRKYLMEVKQLKCQPSGLELKIRREVIDAVNEMIDKLHDPQLPITRMKTLTYTIKDHLNLLWGE